MSFAGFETCVMFCTVMQFLSAITFDGGSVEAEYEVVAVEWVRDRVKFVWLAIFVKFI